ncbi:MAG: hypothetical protein RQ833_03280 [Sphingomonadaceae bacterium]|nr:hypothetical protein [Sphingomonadaceae bacterium]
MTSRFRVACVVLAATSAMAAPSRAATIIDLVRPYTGQWSPIGVPNTSTYGQSFTVGADTVLTGFSLYLNGNPNNEMLFKGYLYAWDGTKAVGPQLYASSVQSFSGVSDNSVPAEIAFNTGNLNLTTGQQYIAFLSTAGLQDGRPPSSYMMPYSAELRSEQYDGGGFQYFNTGDDFSLLTSTRWDTSGSNFGDVWFKARLIAQAVPAPGSLLLLTGLTAVVGLARRRAR